MKLTNLYFITNFYSSLNDIAKVVLLMIMCYLSCFRIFLICIFNQKEADNKKR